MPAKLGKREKIIVGLVIGIAAIAAIHFFIFQSKQQAFNAAKADFEAKRSQAEALAGVNVNDRQFFDAYREQTAKDEQLLWKAVLDMDLIIPLYFSIAEAAPKEPEQETEEARKQYQESMAGYRRRTDPVQVAAEAALIERFEHLLEIARAYEAGRPWKGDAPRQGDPGTHVLKLPFIGQGVVGQGGLPENGWNLPLALPQSIASGASLWDEVSNLHGVWSVLNVMPRESEDYMRVNNEYIEQLKKMGMDMDQFPAISENLCEYLPEFIKMLYARHIWNQRKEGEIPRVGSTENLSLALLKDMFMVDFPRMMDPEIAPQMLNLNRQLWALEKILPLARRNRIDEIQIVKLYKVKPIGTADPAAIAAAKQPAAATPTPARRSLLTGTTGTGANPATGMAMAGFPGGAATPPPSRASVAWLGAPGLGLASHIYLRYVATNENSVRFLYDLLGDKNNFRIDNLTVYSMDDQRITVDLWIDVPIALFQVSLMGDLVDIHGKPLSNVGEEIMAQWRQQQATSPLSVDAAVQTALADAGYPANVLETLETPPPATPEPAPAAAPGMMPGMMPPGMMMPGMPVDGVPAEGGEAAPAAAGLPDVPME